MAQEALRDESAKSSTDSRSRRLHAAHILTPKVGDAGTTSGILAYRDSPTSARRLMKLI
ncbi:hypothetical protein [Merismopedia glauca]|uniref:hypothetical protein n=1 Tax=Merismopedia glauca TaxID=292586 RepID=UPI0015E63065|nr:hypothetical protein [Merismopedia glauca]